MSHWKILLTDGLEESGQVILRAAAQVDDRNGISAAELANVIGDYDALIVRSRTKVTADLLGAATNLKVVGRAGVGVDNIALAAAQSRGITVVNSPFATTLAVAELTLALMLSLARAIPTADSAMKSGQWIKKQLIGAELSGKVLGVVGVGRIGSLVAERAVAFGMKVIGYDPYLSDEIIRERGAGPVSLAWLYQQADFISLHIPLSAETRNMINAQSIGQMKRGVRLICAARGGVVEEEALLAALEAGQVAGAALDVFATEPPGSTALVAHPRVIATPHIGAQTAEAQARAASDIAAELLAALRGEPLRWKVV